MGDHCNCGQLGPFTLPRCAPVPGFVLDVFDRASILLFRYVIVPDSNAQSFDGVVSGNCIHVGKATDSAARTFRHHTLRRCEQDWIHVVSRHFRCRLAESEAASNMSSSTRGAEWCLAGASSAAAGCDLPKQRRRLAAKAKRLGRKLSNRSPLCESISDVAVLSELHPEESWSR